MGATVSSSPWFEFASEDRAALQCPSTAPRPFVDCATGRIRALRRTPASTPCRSSPPTAPATAASRPRARFTVDPTLDPEPPLRAGAPARRRYKGSSLFTRRPARLHRRARRPDGRMWVADHNGGFCRVTEPNEDGAGHIDHPSRAGRRRPAHLPGRPAARGRRRPGRRRPAGASSTRRRLKPGNGDEMALIPDGASPELGGRPRPVEPRHRPVRVRRHRVDDRRPHPSRRRGRRPQRRRLRHLPEVRHRAAHRRRRGRQSRRRTWSATPPTGAAPGHRRRPPRRRARAPIVFVGRGHAASRSSCRTRSRRRPRRPRGFGVDGGDRLRAGLRPEARRPVRRHRQRHRRRRGRRAPLPRLRRRGRARVARRATR